MTTASAAPIAPPRVFSRTSSTSRLRPLASCAISTAMDSTAQAATAPRKRSRLASGVRNPTGANMTTLPTRFRRPRSRFTLDSALRIPSPGSRLTPAPPAPLIVTARTAITAPLNSTLDAATSAATRSPRRSPGAAAAAAAPRTSRTTGTRASTGRYRDTDTAASFTSTSAGRGIATPIRAIRLRFAFCEPPRRSRTNRGQAWASRFRAVTTTSRSVVRHMGGSESARNRP